MSRIKSRLKIELRSDLCTGSGYGYAGVIDTDVVCDSYGLPVIPARRLKGCMREAARLVCEDKVGRLFGEGGKNKTEGIVLGNAYIENYKDITRELRQLENDRPDVFRYLSHYGILGLFTDVRAQTKIDGETGIAEDNTLRYMRVVGEYNPMDEEKYKRLCFYADIEYEACEKDAVERAAKATRNIGMNRNRGLGSVRCSIVPGMDEKEEGASEEDSERSETGRDAETVCITYILKNISPLLMSSNSDNISDSFISGKSILGKMAGSYLAMPDKNAESGEFRDLFLNGSTIFTDVNITFPAYDDKGDEAASGRWRSYFPAPLYLNKTKRSKRLVNLLKREEEAGGVSDKGDLPQKLKNQYVCEAGQNLYDVAEARKEIVYHHSKNGRGAEEGGLYSQEALKEGQYFKGRIYTDSRYVPILKKLLDGGGLRLGKSKTAQYGLCEVRPKPEVEELEEDIYSADGGTCIAVTFVSDAIFMNENGYTVKFEDIKKQVAVKLGLMKEITDDEDEMDYVDGRTDECSMVQTKEVTGYHTTWNLRKPGIPAIKAGSVFVYRIREGMHWEKRMTPMQCFAGERNLEGYGEFRISSLENMRYEAADLSEKAEGKGTQGACMGQVSRTQGIEKNLAVEPGREVQKETLKYCRKLLAPILAQNVYESLVSDYLLYRMDRVHLSASAIGRLMLMLTESLESESEPEKAFTDFCRRISSIKRDRERGEAFRFLKEILLMDDKSEKYAVDFGKMGAKAEERDIYIEYFSEDAYNKMLLGLWGKYLTTILTYQKYRKKYDQD